MSSHTAADDSASDDGNGAVEVQPVARRLRSRHPALLQRLVVLTGDSNEPRALVLEPPPVKAARRQQRTALQRRPVSQQQQQQYWAALLRDDDVPGACDSLTSAVELQQQQQQQQQAGAAVQQQDGLQVAGGSDSAYPGLTEGLMLALIASGRQVPPDAAAAAVTQQQQQGQQLAAVEEALPAPPPLQHVLPVERQQAAEQGSLPGLHPPLQQDQPGSDQQQAGCWTSEWLQALLLASSGEQQGAAGAGRAAADYAAIEIAAHGTLAGATAAAVVAATAAPVCEDEAVAASSECRLAVQKSDTTACAQKEPPSSAQDGTCSTGDAGAWQGCDAEAVLATSRQAAQLEKHMLPQFIHAQADDGTAAATATLAPVAAAAAVADDSLVGAAGDCSGELAAAGSSHASTGCAAAAADAATACPATAAADDEQGLQLQADSSDDDQQHLQPAMQGQQQKQQQQHSVCLDPSQQQQQCIECVDASQQLPAKDAQPGDYLKVEPNSRWDPAAFEAAAAAGAEQLGLAAAEPAAERCAGQAHLQQQLQQPLESASGKAGATTAEDVAAESEKSGTAPQEVAAAAAAAEASGGQLPATARSAEFGVLMMTHDKGVAHTAAWQEWEASHEGRVVVLVHCKAGVQLSASVPGADWLASGRQLHTRVASQWGDISLTQAVLGAAAEMLQRCPRLQHIAVVSGQDVPVAALQLPLPAGASLIGCFQFGREYDAAARRVAAAVLQQQLGMCGAEAAAWGESLTFHHTWLVMSR
jgi:hypothetical protein